MKSKFVSMQLDGSISLEKFSRTLSSWEQLLRAVALEADPDSGVHIILQDLVFGSALVSVEIMLATEAMESHFSNSFRSIGLAVRDGNIVNFPKAIREPAQKLLNALKLDDGGPLILSTDEFDIVIPNGDMTKIAARNPKQDQLESIGVITGRLQALSSRGALRFTLYDLLNDRAIRCALTEDQRDDVRELWDHVVEVQGLIRRDPATGIPLSIREISRISLAQGTKIKERWLGARGVLQRISPDVASEVLVRRLRDA